MTEKPLKVIASNEPYYNRKYVLPLTSALQSKEPWKWPPPMPPDYDLLDRILNTTTLTTQCVTHKQILEFGENAHSDFTGDLKARIAEIEKLQQNFVNIVAQEVVKVKAEMEQRYKQLLTQYLTEQKSHMTDKWDQKLETMLELEKEKVARLNIEWQLRMDDALLQQREELEIEHRKQLEEALRRAEKVLNDDVDQRVAEALKKQLEGLEGGFRDRLDRKIAELNAQHKEEMENLRREMNRQHETDTSEIKSKWRKMCERYKQLVEFSRNVERDYLLLEEDYKKFINNVKGAGGYFGSDYLLRHKQHGIIVMQSEKPSPITMDKPPPDFDKLKKRQEIRQLSLAELSAAFNDPDFWPERFFSSTKDKPETPRKEGTKSPYEKFNPGNLIPVKLVRPLDSDEIGNVLVPVKIPEQNGASFILSFNDM